MELEEGPAEGGIEGAAAAGWAFACGTERGMPWPGSVLLAYAVLLANAKGCSCAGSVDVFAKRDDCCCCCSDMRACCIHGIGLSIHTGDITLGCMLS